jgi:rod shape-determining protein MreB
MGGDKFDEAIVRYMRKHHNLLIGERSAEKLKIEIRDAYSKKGNKLMRVSGRNLVTGLPEAMNINPDEILKALEDCVEQIVITTHSVLEKTPPELAADISDAGIIMTGGGALLYGLDKRIEQSTGIKVIIADDPLSCVAKGTGSALTSLDLLEKGGTFKKKKKLK